MRKLQPYYYLLPAFTLCSLVRLTLKTLMTLMATSEDNLLETALISIVDLRHQRTDSGALSMADQLFIKIQ